MVNCLSIFCFLLVCVTQVHANPSHAVLSQEAIAEIPFDDGMDENGQLDEQAMLFKQQWLGKHITMRMGGIKQTEHYAWCQPAIKGARAQSIVTGKLISRPRGGSGGNMLILNHCKLLKK